MGTVKPKQYDWKDTNMELFGSDIDREVKKNAACEEKAWRKVANLTEPDLFIWRIEQFKVVEWPREYYGTFYSGDSYIILNAFKQSECMYYDVHFWIGRHSTQDEYGTAAYKTVELDTFLDDKPIQHREVEGHESELFKSYFKTIKYLKGGTPSGFRHVQTREYKPRLLHIKGDKPKYIVVKEVAANLSNMNSGDVFILDLGTEAYQWVGKQASIHEKFRGAQFLSELTSERSGRLTHHLINEGEEDEELLNYLQEKEDEDTIDLPDQKHCKLLFRLSDSSGELKFTKIAEGNFNQNDITEDDVWIIDNGEALYVYVGEGASYAEKKNAMIYAHNYLKQTEYPCLPITVMNNQATGTSKELFKNTLAV